MCQDEFAHFGSQGSESIDPGSSRPLGPKAEFG